MPRRSELCEPESGFWIRHFRTLFSALVLLLCLRCFSAGADWEKPAHSQGRPAQGRLVLSKASVQPAWFNTKYSGHAVVTILMSILVVGWTIYARRRPEIFVRRIPGLDALEQAVGRAVEMGRPLFFSPGILPLTEIPTVAAVNVLKHVARLCARYGAELRVYNIYPGVHAVTEETVKEAYTEEAKGSAFKRRSVVFLAAEQFSYAAALSGLIVRARPASVLYFGPFYAESLILTETGLSCGTLQIAGTDKYTQLPFFVTTCDYVIMGDEFYAASAYLSRQPVLLGSLKAQDCAKAALMAALAAGFLLESLGCHVLKDFFLLK